MSLIMLIADTIQKADSSYLFEDYTKQANAVLQALRAEGYAIVPKTATPFMLEVGEKAIQAGKVKPQEHVRHIYTAMVASGEKERPAPKTSPVKA